VVGINDIMDIELAVYLLKYDSVYGNFDYHIAYDDHFIYLNNQPIKYTSYDDNTQIECDNVDVIYECSGVYRTSRSNEHFSSRSKVVIISAPATDDTPTYILGANEESYRGEKIISASSCTANAIAPLIKNLDLEFGIKRGSITVTHSYTSDQSLLDGQNRVIGRRSRAAGVNLIPLRSSVATEVMGLFPAIALAGINVRVPALNAMMLNLMLELKSNVQADEVQSFLTHLEGDIITLRDIPLVSSDIKKFKQSAIVDQEIQVIGGNMIGLTLFQDNERAYAKRLLELSILCLRT
jgi:glyceraldehyde 3-phosphate dehydrogenase